MRPNKLSRRSFLTIVGLSLLSHNDAQADAARTVYLPLIQITWPHRHPVPGSCLTAYEQELASLINAYRATRPLPGVPVSRSLSIVAQWHVIDLFAHRPNQGTDSRGLPCNLHSWSGKGVWTPVCYTPDHAYAAGMWDKPQEITRGLYPNNGFEIASAYPDGYGYQMTPSIALDSWKGSTGHSSVILEQGDWDGSNWQAMGVGIYENYAVVWFGHSADPQGTMTTCSV
jgi:hypothetical protein